MPLPQPAAPILNRSLQPLCTKERGYIMLSTCQLRLEHGAAAAYASVVELDSSCQLRHVPRERTCMQVAESVCRTYMPTLQHGLHQRC
jgi:hypothetical protein